MTRYLFGFLGVFALSLMLSLGCGEGGGEGGSGGTAGSGGTGGAGGAETAMLTIYTGDWRPDLPGDGLAGPLEGVEVCEADTTNCVVTDSSGLAQLPLPVDEEVILTVEKKGYDPMLGSEKLVSGGLNWTSFAPATMERVTEQFGRLMSPYPMQGTGSVFIQVYGGRPEVAVGATLELIGTTGKRYYRDEDHNWSLELTATASGGGGGFVEISPGEYQIEIGGAVGNCSVYRGWLGDAPNRVRFPVREGYGSTVRVDCD